MPEPTWSLKLSAAPDERDLRIDEAVAIGTRRWTLEFAREGRPFLVFRGESFDLLGDIHAAAEFGRFLDTALPLSAEELMLLGEGLGEIATSPLTSEDDVKRCEALAGRLATKLVQIIRADPG